MEALFYEAEGEAARCGLCPRRCLIAEGKCGFCGVRRTSGSKLILPYAGRISALALDPIEKKPLYHFLPGSSVLSVGFSGCNLACPYCQNHELSRNPGAQDMPMSPAALAAMAKEQSLPSIAFTYSEPLVHIEYVAECAKAARKAGIRTVLVSNGYASAEAADYLIPLLDAANIDLKSSSDEYYRRVLGGSLEPIVEFIGKAARRIHLEITFLAVTGDTDTEQEIEGVASIIAAIDSGIPLHISRYFPRHRYERPATDISLLYRLAAVAKRRLDHVYVGNVHGAESNSACTGCGAVLVRRRGYEVDRSGLLDGRCACCGAPQRFVDPASSESF